MNKADCYQNQPVTFLGKDKTKFTGKITKMNGKSATVVQTQAVTERNGTIRPNGLSWRVSYGLLSPVDPNAAPPKNAKRAPTPKPGSPEALDALQVVVGKLDIKHDPSKDTTSEAHDEFKERQDRHYVGTIELNGKVLPIDVHLILGGSFYPDKWSVSCDVGDDLPALKEENYKSRSTWCDHCSGSGLTTSGNTAKAVASVVFPFLKEAGYKIEGRPKDLYPTDFFLFNVHARITGPDRDVPAKRRFHSAWKTPIDCPVHGKYDKFTSEFNA